MRIDSGLPFSLRCIAKRLIIEFKVTFDQAFPLIEEHVLSRSPIQLIATINLGSQSLNTMKDRNPYLEEKT